MNYRVVLVDDLPEIRQILRLVLEHAGPFDVVGEGGNGHDAVALADELQPDLIVMDVEMRGGPTGWQVLPQIRQSSPGTAVVILSGSAADPTRTEGEAMADGVLEKGLAPQELNAALLAILGRPAGAATSASTAPTSTAATWAEPTAASAALAAVLDLTSDAVIELTPELTIRSWNRGAERLYGAAAADVIGKPFGSLCTEESWVVVEDLLEQALGGVRVEGATVEQRASRGALRLVALSVAPLDTGAVVVARDVPATQASDQAMAWVSAELDAKQREVERIRRELEGFASVASHDLAQPLQVAYGYLEMVRTEFTEGMDETAASWIESAVGSLERMRLLVQAILAYARGGIREIVNEPVSVEQVTLSALASVERFVEERAAEVRIRPPLPTVSGHDDHLANVIEELLDNAVRFVPADRVPVVEVFAEEAAGEWIVTVADNGAGISPELSERVFDVFHRGAKTTNSGTGLGLSLARKLVDRMGGRIWAEPRPDGAEGTWMRFALPKDSP